MIVPNSSKYILYLGGSEAFMPERYVDWRIPLRAYFPKA
jgi:hypothetical protein